MTLEQWTKDFKNKKVIITKGEYEGLLGVFKKATGYSASFGAIVAIKLGTIKEVKHFTPDFFEFVNPLAQEEWDRDD